MKDVPSLGRAPAFELTIGEVERLGGAGFAGYEGSLRRRFTNQHRVYMGRPDMGRQQGPAAFPGEGHQSVQDHGALWRIENKWWLDHALFSNIFRGTIWDLLASAGKPGTE